MSLTWWRTSDWITRFLLRVHYYSSRRRRGRAVTQLGSRRPTDGWTARTALSGDRLSTETSEQADTATTRRPPRSPSTAVSGRDVTSSRADDEYLNGHAAARRADRCPVGRYIDYILLMQHTHTYHGYARQTRLQLTGKPCTDTPAECPIRNLNQCVLLVVAPLKLMDETLAALSKPRVYYWPSHNRLSIRPSAGTSSC